jgi:DNA-binding CsgD family transcriptional regulator
MPPSAPSQEQTSTKVVARESAAAAQAARSEGAGAALLTQSQIVRRVGISQMNVSRSIRTSIENRQSARQPGESGALSKRQRRVTKWLVTIWRG